jgi:hypothetical protein
MSLPVARASISGPRPFVSTEQPTIMLPKIAIASE